MLLIRIYSWKLREAIAMLVKTPSQRLKDEMKLWIEEKITPRMVAILYNLEPLKQRAERVVLVKIRSPSRREQRMRLW
jgi:hypothetical protein